MTPIETNLGPSPLLQSWDNEELRYSFVWEDFECLMGALPTTQTQSETRSRILSIGSAGDNALALLLADPKQICAIDLSPAQNALLELKRASITQLSFDDYLQFFFGPFDEKIFFDLIPQLSLPAQSFWKRYPPAQQDNIHTSGRLDRYFNKFRDYGLKSFWSDDDFQALLTASDKDSQMRLWEKGDLQKLHKSATDFFSRTALSTEGRHPAQFQYVNEENLGPIFLQRFLNLLKSQLISENPYLSYFLSGRPAVGQHPLWTEKTYDIIRERIDRVQIETIDLESFLQRRNENFDFMNLSDIFEYLSESAANLLFTRLSAHLTKGGRLAYWTLLVDRSPNCTSLTLNRDLSRRLSAVDRTWFYSDFRVAEKVS